MKYSELKQRFKNKYVIRTIAGILTVALIGTGFHGYSVLAAKNDSKEHVISTESSSEDEPQEDIQAVIREIADNAKKDTKTAIGKDETVYLIADANGTVQKTIVSDWLKNEAGKAELEDRSDLTDIENVKGDESFRQDGENLIWQAGGKDIYYQGQTAKAAPISVKLTYYLDGTEISADELAGKSGTVTIRFDYTNHEKTTQMIDGESYEVYVPFTVVSGMILGDNFKNIEVTNGKIISDGKNNVVVGMAIPGLQESLKAATADFDEDIQLPDYVEMTADVEDFAMDMTVTVATTSLLEDLNINGGLDFSKLDATIGDLSDASVQLVDGSGELTEGLAALKKSLGAFTSGAGDLKRGIGDYTAGVKTLADGIASLNNGTASLTDGMSTINSSAASISSGITQLDKTLKKAFTAEEKAALQNEVNTAIDSQKSDIQKSAREAVGAKVGDIKSQAGAKVTAQLADDTNPSSYNNVKAYAAAQFEAQLTGNAALKGGVSAGLEEYTRQMLTGVLTQALSGPIEAQIRSAYPGIGDAEAAAAVQNQIAAQVEAAMSSAAIQSGIDTTSTQLTAGIAGGVKESVGTAVAEAAKTGAVTAAQEAAVTAAKEAAAEAAYTGAKSAAGAAAISAAEQTKQTVVSGIEAADEATGYSLVTGSKALAAGTQTMVDSIPELTGGITSLLTGANTLVSNNSSLNSGAASLADGTTKVTDGVNKLESGSKELAAGMKEFDEKAIQKLADAYHGDVKSLLNRMDAAMQAGKSYTSFSQVADGVTGSVKFIIKTDAVKSADK